MERLHIVPVIWTNPAERGILGLVTRYASARYDWFMTKHAAYYIREARLYMYRQTGPRAP